MDKITKADLVDNIYKDSKYERQTVQAVVDDFILELRKHLQSGATIELRGFGTFEARLRKGRKDCRNPKTGSSCSSEPHYVAAFRAGQELKKSLFELEIKKDESN